jgi:hypothetical protein
MVLKKNINFWKRGATKTTLKRIKNSLLIGIGMAIKSENSQG